MTWAWREWKLMSVADGDKSERSCPSFQRAQVLVLWQGQTPKKEQ